MSTFLLTSTSPHLIEFLHSQGLQDLLVVLLYFQLQNLSGEINIEND